MTTQLPIKTSQADGAQPASEVDQQALAAIRDLLDGETKSPAQPAAERQSPQATEEPLPPNAPNHRAPKKPKAEARRAAKVSTGGGLVAQIKSALLGYRPTPRHVVLAGFGLLVLFRPLLVLGIAFLSVIVMIGVFLILGYDGFWRRAMGLARWYAARRPARAAHFHTKLDAFAMRWDAILDRFPEGSVDGLYLPDFGDLATADSRHDDALDRRFADMRKNEA